MLQDRLNSNDFAHVFCPDREIYWKTKTTAVDQLPNNNVLVVFERLSAFHLYKTYGLEMACSIYPHHEEFILVHSSKTLEEVRRESYKDLDKKDNLL